jgi:hypothetical protein
VSRSWKPSPPLHPSLQLKDPQPGQFPVDHGTMCAFDACIAAPNCTLLDIALLTSTAAGLAGLTGFLSDAIRAYSHLLSIMLAESRSLVVNNSWAQYDLTSDLPPGNPGNYSDNPNHPFNRIVGDLDRAGADILFAAGNCGAPCPASRCQGINNTITGANGHPSVLTVAGVDTTKTRVGYSSTGSGRLTVRKPDISGYTHFRGSGAFIVDSGTSAAAPVVAGVVAAVRSKLPYDPGNPATHPAAIRNLVTSTAEDLGPVGSPKWPLHDFEHGFGVVNGCELVNRLGIRLTPGIPSFNFCQRYPDICEQIGLRDPSLISNLCQKYPWLCHELQIPLPIDPPGPVPPVEMHDPAELGYLAGYHDGLRAQSSNVKRGT